VGLMRQCRMETRVNKLDEKKLGQRLQAARQKAGLTQQALCQKAGLSYSTLAKIERGAIKTPSVFTIQNIAAALGTTLDELVGAPVLAAKQWQRSRSGVKFVYFDINGCLVQFSLSVFTRIAADCDLPSDVVETAFWHYNDQISRGEMTIEEFNSTMGKRLGLRSFDWAAYYLDTVRTVPQMDQLVAWVSQHYGVGLLTNSMPGFVKRMTAAGLIPNIQYDAIVDSSEVHALKPEREIYEIALSRAGCDPQEILFVDDLQGNVMAGERLGWHVMRFDVSDAEKSVARIREALEPAD
jgi:putative hydrolase of the HAD superfamily